MKIYWKFGLILFLLTVLYNSSTNGEEEPEYKVKSALIEQFTRFIEWPLEILDSNNPDSFTIGIVGKNPFGHYLEELSKLKKIKNKIIKIQILSDISELDKIPVLFISKSEKNRINKIIALTENKPILTIGDTEGYAEKGVMINIYIEDNLPRFEVNKRAVDKSGLRFSSKLLEHAKILYFE
jgi:hypothetical protein